MPNTPRVSSIQAHHVAGLIVLVALIFLVGVERGFRGLKIDIS